MNETVTSKKRGRPPLTPEQRAQRAIARAEYKRVYDKARGYDRQKRFRAKKYAVLLWLPAEKRDLLDNLLKKLDTSPRELFIDLVNEKYEIDLS